jgi:hypothetical protein
MFSRFKHKIITVIDYLFSEPDLNPSGPLNKTDFLAITVYILLIVVIILPTIIPAR